MSICVIILFKTNYLFRRTKIRMHTMCLCFRKVSPGIETFLFAELQPVMPTLGEGKNAVPADIADPIASMVQAKFTELSAPLPVHLARRKVLAGFVLTRDQSLDSAEVICVTTGTKCVNGEYISGQGLTLNDSHAEILARRALKMYFYNQLKLHLSEDGQGEEESIFEKREGGGFNLKDNIDIHLFISTSPCGDARIFSPHENSDGKHDLHPNRKARGQLRTKIESGEGTIPVKSKTGIQTWDGIMQGQRLLTMSCSDKMARWNVLGLQGEIVQSIFLYYWLAMCLCAWLFIDVK